MAEWEVTRLELVYYNRRHKRWQIWQESGTATAQTATTPGELHRRQIFSLLHAVRGCLAEVAEVKPSLACPSTHSSADETKPIFFNIGNAGSPLRTILAAGEANRFWRSYLGYIAGTAKSYGIVDSPSSTSDGSIIRSLCEFLGQESLKSLEQQKEIPIARNVALDLISMLPILHTWDLQGCWYRAMRKPGKWRGLFPPSGTWKMPFYIAHISEEGDNCPPDATHFDKCLVDRPLTVQMQCIDLAILARGKRARSPKSLPVQNFFDYCSRPTGSDEIRLYQAYAFLFDKLLSALQVGNEHRSGTAGGHEWHESDGKESFVAYPIHVLGRLNFLHIWVRGKSADSSLDSLWKFWFENVHTDFWNQASEFLRLYLPTIAHTNFQSVWQDAIVSEKGATASERLVKSLCGCANLLMPFQWIQWQDGQVDRTWGYERFDCVDNQKPPWIGAQTKSDDGEYGSLGVRWSERTLPKDAEKLDEIQVNGQCIRYRLSQASAQTHGDSLERGAVKLTIEQQLGLGDMYLRLHDAKRKDQKENGLLSIKMHFSRQQNILNYLASADAGDITIDITAGSLKDDFGSNMTITALTNILGADVSELINRFITASLTVRASMYLESGPLCDLGHLGDSTGPEVPSLIAGAKKLEGFDDLPFPSKGRSHLRAPIKAWKKEIRQMFSHLGRFESQIERFKDSHSRARCPFSQDPNDFTKAFGRTVQFSKRGGLRTFRPCLPVLDLFLPRILRAPFSQDADVQVQAFAVPTSHEAEAQEGIWTNVFCLRGAGDMLGKCPTPDRFVKDVQHDGIRAYGRLIVGCCGSSGETELFDCTHGGQIRTTVDELFPDKTPSSYKRLLNSTISLTDRYSWLIALLFDTQRSR